MNSFINKNDGNKTFELNENFDKAKGLNYKL